MAPNQLGEVLGGPGMMAADVIGCRWLRGLGGRFALAELFHRNQASHVRQSDFHRLRGENLYEPPVDAPVFGVEAFAKKRGVAVVAILAAWSKALGWFDFN